MFLFIDWKLPPPACPGTTGKQGKEEGAVILLEEPRISRRNDQTNNKRISEL